MDRLMERMAIQRMEALRRAREVRWERGSGH
jgi:hypothetical protein